MVASAIFSRYAFMSAEDWRDSGGAPPPPLSRSELFLDSPSSARRNWRTSSIRRLSMSALISCASFPMTFATRSMVTRRCSVRRDIMTLSLQRASVSVAAV